MAKSTNYSSGAVSGMTGVSAQSLYRYVREFPEFFTERVRSHKRGRRWEDDDVLVVLSLQNLFTKRLGKQAILEELRSGWRLDVGGEASPEMRQRLSEIYEVAQLYREEARADRTASHELGIRLARLIKRNHDDHSLLLDLQKAIENQQREINRMNSQRKSFINLGHL